MGNSTIKSGKNQETKYMLTLWAIQQKSGGNLGGNKCKPYGEFNKKSVIKFWGK